MIPTDFILLLLTEDLRLLRILFKYLSFYKIKFFMKNILIGTFILFSITFCKSKKRSKQTENAVSTSQIQLVKAPSSPDYLDSELNLSDINLTSTDSSYLVNFSFDVKNYELGVLTSDANDRDIANSEKGQHIHLILNNEPYSAHYDSFAQKNLS